MQNNSSTATDNTFLDNNRINISSISPIINGYQTTILKFSKSQEYICNNKQISFEAENQAMKQS